jgi:PAS domain S-box-containing protein
VWEPAELERFIAILPEACLVVSGDGQVVAANPAVASLLGIDPGTLRQKPLHDAVKDPAATVALWLRDCARGMGMVPGTLEFNRDGAQPVACHVEGAALRPRSEEGPALVLLRLTPKHAYVARFTTQTRRVEELTREIARRKRAEAALIQSEDRLRMAVEASHLGTFHCDLPFRRLRWNARCKEHFGLPPEADVTIELFYRSIHPDDRERVRQAMEYAIAERTDYSVEFRTVEPTGQIRWILGRGRASYSASGRPYRFDGITMDVTDRKQAEHELEDAKDALEAASNARDRFLSLLSHELRTPLTPVLASLTALTSEGHAPAELQDELAMYRRNLEIEARLIDDLLELTLLERGSMRLHFEPVDVHAALEQALALCRGEIESKRLTVAETLEAPRHHVWGDPARVPQVLWKLISNAAQFTPEGGTITLASENDAEGWLLVHVRDSGVGIGAEALARIFDAFEQERTRHRSRHGLGLGLAIAQQLVAMHHGTLTAESLGKDRGAVFTLRLKALAPGQTSDPDALSAGEGGPQPSPRRLLLVEDHEDTLRTLARLLSLQGYHVSTAGSVSEALRLSGEERFDLLISDIGLPDGTGMDVIRSLRQNQPIPGIALSGFGTDDDRRRSREAGFAEHLTKPIDFSQLKRAVRRLLG